MKKGTKKNKKLQLKKTIQELLNELRLSNFKVSIDSDSEEIDTSFGGTSKTEEEWNRQN